MISYRSETTGSGTPSRLSVAIVGIPNVGKSTLFNRLLGRHQAITDPTPGVTRDPIRGVWAVGERELLLIDTGGYTDRGTDLDDLVSDRSVNEAESASLLLLVVDVQGATMADEELIHRLRPHRDRTILVVNKVDSPKREAQVWNFHSLGISRVIGVSSAHGINFGELEEAVLDMLGPVDEEVASNEEPDIRIALMGKPNTGKSTLLNQLTGGEAAIVSDTPGTTRDVVSGEFSHSGKNYLILDTAGIRRRTRVQSGVEYYSVNRSIRCIREADVVLLVLDSLESVVDQDKKIAQLVVSQGRGVILVLNKWDLQVQIPNRYQAMVDRIRFLFPILSFAPVVAISALTGDGVPELLKVTHKVWLELNRRIETSRLNAALNQWVEFNEPTGRKGFRYKVRYITQATTNPIKFVLFVNRKRGFPSHYLGYIANNIRTTFGYGRVPFSIEVRGR